MSKNTKKVLMIAYHFPPINSSGVYRTLKFVKYLPTFDWIPAVLTCKNPDVPYLDFDLLDEIPGGVTVYRTLSFQITKLFTFLSRIKLILNRFNHRRLVKQDSGSYKNGQGIGRKILNKILIPDDQISWLPTALLKALQICKKERMDVIYTTSPPASTHLVGYLLAKIIRIPWVADFRDPWTQNFRTQNFNRYKKILEQRLEKAVVEQASRVIMTTKTSRENLLQKYDTLCKKKVVVITNGFDPDDFKEVASFPRGSDGKLTLTYTGYVYEKTARSFFTAVEDLVKEIPRLTQKLRINFIGKLSAEYVHLLQNSEENVRKVFALEGYKGHQKTIQSLLRSHVLLYFVGAPYWIPSKLFEYLMVKRPVLAIAPQGDAAEIIAQCKIGTVIPVDDIQGIKNKILEYLALYEKNSLTVQPDNSQLLKFDRRYLTKQLAQIMDKLVTNNPKVPL